MSEKIESFGEIDSSKDRPRASLGFAKPIRSGLRKKPDLIASRSSKTGLAGRKDEVRFQKEE